MRFDNLADWLSWQEQHHPSAIDLGLARVKQVAERLDLIRPRSDRTIITIAGTNGKGSAVATLESLCLANGDSVGAYTSPHLQHYNERIRVNGNMADDALICRAFAAIDGQAQDISLTYFEFGTLAALWIFNELKLCYWLLEVGLGGRLDAVNIIDADAAIITSIALDHQDWLGTDLAAIGREKAGVFRAQKPAVYIDSRIEKSVLASAEDVGAVMALVGRDFQVQVEQGRCSVDISSSGTTDALCLQFPEPALPWPSVCAALVAAQRLGLPIPSVWLRDVLPLLSVPGRFQRFDYRGRRVILDVAHNPAACHFFLQRYHHLLRQLSEAEPSKTVENNRVHLILAMMADKDTCTVLKILQPEVDCWYFPELPGIGRAAKATDMADQLGQLDSQCVEAQYANVAQALEAALQATAPNDSICVLGSFFTVAAALDWFAQHPEH